MIYFCIAADERIVVATSEPTSITDAYAANAAICGLAKDGLPVLGKLTRVKADSVFGVTSPTGHQRLHCNFRHTKSGKPEKSFIIEVQIVTEKAYDYYRYGPTAHTIYDAWVRRQKSRPTELAKITEDLENKSKHGIVFRVEETDIIKVGQSGIIPAGLSEISAKLS